MPEKLVEVKDVEISFGEGSKKFVAVHNANFFINKGETFSLVGESGSGKTTIGRAIIGLNDTSNGEIIFDGKKINGHLSHSEKNDLIRRIQMIFQDPAASLNERATVDYILSEGLHNFHLYKGEEDRKAKIKEIIKEVGLLEEHLTRYPHEFSGGQRQRIGIARALIMQPQCIICDEPISALDVSIQVQIMTLLERLQEQHGISYLFISHDLNMVRYISHRMVVMYLGAVMEEGPALDLYEFPQHPYTRALTALNGPVIPHAPIGAPLKGDPPNPLNPPKGCLFSGRCPEAEGRCFAERPPLRDWADRRIACWHI